MELPQLMSSRKHASLFSAVPVLFGVCRARQGAAKQSHADQKEKLGKSTCILVTGRPSWRRDRLTPALQRTWTAPPGAAAGCHSCGADHVLHAPAAQGQTPRKLKLPTAASGSCFTQNQFPPLTWLVGIQDWKVGDHVGTI